MKLPLRTAPPALGPCQPIFCAPSASADWIRTRTGESNDIARLDAPPKDVTTGNWEALQDYTDALALNVKRQPEEAVMVLESEVRAVPQFALAYAQLGDILTPLSRTQEGYSAYRRALDPQLVNRLTRSERDRICVMSELDTTDYTTGVAAFPRLFLLL